MVFGDRYGLALFLACLCTFGLTWRAGVSITDTATLTNGLAALSEGRLWIEPATGTYLTSPGTYVHDGLVYGRNYGQLVLTLPFLWLVRGIGAVADLRLGLTAVWHLLALALVVQLGHLFDANRPVRVAGSVAVLLSFVANVALVGQFVNVSHTLLALQLATMVAGASLAVVLYRLVARYHGRTAGLLVGGATAIATPVGIWAVAPKRHVFTALLCASILYTFARSRSPSSVSVPVLGRVPAFRAAAYGFVGLLAWIHAAEGLFVVLALVLVDVPTAPSNDRRSLAFVAGIFALAMVPFVATNLAVAGHPFRPPRSMLDAGTVVLDDGGTGSGAGPTGGPGGGTGGSGGSGGGTGLPFLDVLAPLLLRVRVALFWLDYHVVGRIVEGTTALFTVDHAYHTFLRSGSLEHLAGNPEFRGLNLSVVESVPLLAGIVGALAASLRRFRDVRMPDPTELLAVALGLSLTLFYAPKLPTHVQVGVRYLLPLYPLGLYLVVRRVAVTDLVDRRGRLAVWTYAGAVLIGSQLLVTYVVAREMTIAQAAQTQAILGVGIGILFVLTLTGRTFDDRFDAPAGVAMGLAAAAGTAFVLLTGLVYLGGTGEHVLPVAEFVGDLLELG